MLRRFSTIFILSFLLVAFIAMTAFAARTQEETARKFSPTIDKSLYYSYPDETLRQDGSGAASIGRSAYSKSSAAASPGVVLGDTWYDYQHNGTIGRMIDWGPYGGNTGDPIIHFGWMALPADAFVSRYYAYQHFNATTGLLGSVVAIQPQAEYAGYVGMSVTPDNKGVPGGHNDQGGGNQTHIYYDFSPGFGFFSANSRVEDSVATYPASSPVQAVIWPKFAYQVGTDTVTHVIAQVSAPAAADPQAIYYFRKVGYEATGTWDYPPYVVDTIYDLSHDIVADRNSDKVAMSWTANLRYDANGVMLADGVCDTCSGTSPIHVQWDNDIYYQISDDQGATWNPRVNVTLNRLGEVGYRPYTDLSSTIDAAGNLHIAWSGVNWPADPAGDGWGWDCRMFHWSEDNPVIRTVSNLGEFTQEECIPGAWNINMSKMQVSECDGKIYVLWVQFNTAQTLDDCALRADGGAGDISGAVNGELYIAVSSDGGLTWDAPRNLTNSYTPGCEPGTAGDCESDNWPSMTRYGRQDQAGEDWTNAVVVDPSGTYAGDYYLDVQYVHDRDAGGIVQNEGTWQLSNLNWFRLACVEPVPNPALVLTPVNVAQPTWTKPSTQLDLDVTIENTGNVALTYSIVVEEDNGTGGWLNYSGLSGNVPSGLSNVETGSLHLNNGGVQTTAIGLEGRLIFNSNAPTTPDTMEVFVIVADTVQAPVFDTIESACLALAVSNTGNYGQSGTGTANLDWVFSGSDCDTLATVYLYDGSPIIVWDTSGAGDFDAAWSIFGDGWLSENGFRPLGGHEAGTAAGGANTFYTGIFVDQDSTLGVEKTWYANTDVADCDYMIQKLKIWSYDGAAHNGLRIGEAIDWDVPSDSGANNGSGFDATRNLIYQIGGEYNAPEDTLECQDNDTRYGGMGFLKSVLNGTLRFEAVPRAYTARNDSFVFPAGNFIPNQLDSLMSLSGFTNETEITDLHSVMVFEQNFDLAATDTIVFWMVVATVESGTASDLQTAYDDAKAWAEANNYWEASGGCCFGTTGNVDNGPDDGTPTGSIDIADLVYIVAYSFGGGPAPVCIEEGDIDASGGAIPIDIADIVYLVNYMFAGGAAPPACP